jgi:excinuclease ABC subunit A
MSSEKIIIQGARQHNLKNIDLELPRNKLLVITGLSGSGKSTLAFDTLYAEGQRRYVESLSTYARQFLERMDKPDVDLIEGLSPAIAIEQKTSSHNPRSTVGTVTEIYDYLRLLFARAGTPHCYRCGRPITSQSIDQIVDSIMSLTEDTRVIILAPLISGQKGSHEKLFRKLKKEGFARVRVDGEILEIEEVDKLSKTQKHDIDVVVDRLIVKPAVRKRLADSLELALAQSGGQASVHIPGKETILFSEKSACIQCDISYPEFTPASFSFNSPQGACRNCDGLGTTTELAPELIVPNPKLSLREGAVSVWAKRNSMHFIEFLDALTKHYGTDIYTPFEELSEAFQRVILYGSNHEMVNFYFERNHRRYTYQKPFEGVIPNLERRYRETDSNYIRQEIKQYMNFRPCSECNGTKLNRASRSVKIGNLNISEITALSVAKIRDFFLDLRLNDKQQIIAHRILKEIVERLGFLQSVGLSYLTLDRSAQSLSGGESQRIRLATQIGSKLTGVLYVLDEPSIGLHQKDNQRLLKTLLKMRDLGNTVLVVEHDEETIRSADYAVDMGPGAGVNGGRVVFAGTPEKLLTHESSLTGQYLSGRKSIPIPAGRRSNHKPQLIVEGATQNNLKNIRVAFPLGCFICVTGVSGSGKSTLVLETLYPALVQKLRYTRIPAGSHSHVLGIEHIANVINIDQSPIGRTPRSNPGTYTGLFSSIRELFSRTPEARMRGYKPGLIKIEMHFLPDVYVVCDVCHGNRYNRETLEIRYKGRNIKEILEMTVNQATDFFSRIAKIRAKLQTLVDVGLGYIQVGQPATTLSGGEAQRVKLSRELSKKGSGKTIYILDEPTTGLHVDDIRKLLEVLNQLVETGNTVIVIEHNMDVIKTADHIIDLGPEGGEEGGYVIGCGSPEEITAISNSYTGQYLAKILG